MTNIEKIRAIIQDTPLYSMCDAVMDGVRSSLQLLYFPVVASSVIITGTADIPTVDEDNGVLTFATAPAEQTLVVEFKHVLFLDSAIQVFLDLNDDSIRLAAADALDSMATSQALIQKKIKLLDMQTDGPALALALRAHAKTLREQEALLAGGAEADFDIAEQVFDEAGLSERIMKLWLRQGV